MMKYAQVYALLLLFVFHSSCGQNQTNTAKDNVFKEPDSGSQSKKADTSKVPAGMVRNVRQARNGDILVASCTGVYRYDARQNDQGGLGKSFTSLTSEIPSPCFWDVLEDRKGNLWFASKDSGIYYYPAHLAARRPTGAGSGGNKEAMSGGQHFSTRNGLPSNIVLHIYEDRAGNIWFSTGGGVCIYVANQPAGQISFQNFSTKDGLPNNSVHIIMEDKTGKIWIGSSGDLCFYDPRQPEGEEKKFTTLTNKDGKGFRNVWGITEDKKGNIWFGGGDNLWRYDGSIVTLVSTGSAYAIIQDKKGNLWTTGGVNPDVWAVSRYDANSLYNKTPAITEIKSGRPAFLGILEANDGSIWFGALGPESGVHRYDPNLPDGEGKSFTHFKSKEDQQ